MRLRNLDQTAVINQEELIQTLGYLEEIDRNNVKKFNTVICTNKIKISKIFKQNN